MNFINKLKLKVDTWQRKHPAVSFPYAVIKKYGEDKAGYQAALLTYYGFLALFPLLLVLTTVASIVAGQNEELQQTILSSLTTYFPAFSDQLSSSIGSMDKGGIALAIGILLSLYGARGVADAFRSGVNDTWHVPQIKRDSFPKALLKSLSIIVIGGAGFLLASISAGYAAAAGHGIGFRVLSVALNLIILFLLFNFLLKISLAKPVSFKETRAGAATAAVGLVILQSVGGIILARELRNLEAVYSTFAITLGLLFWIYLQAQVLYYAVEIAAVRSQNLWPRAIDSENPTAADKRAYTRMPASEQYLPEQKITSKFNKSSKP